jgi:hypothetical protein
MTLEFLFYFLSHEMAKVYRAKLPTLGFTKLLLLCVAAGK